MAKVLRPVVWVLQGSGALLLRPFGITEVMAGESVRTPEELREIVDEAEGSGVIPRAQEELLHNVFDFAGREVRDVMVPSPDVVWIEASATGRGGAAGRGRDLARRAIPSAPSRSTTWSGSCTCAT